MDLSLPLLEDNLPHPLLRRSAHKDWSHGRVYRESWLRLDSFAAAGVESQSESATFPASADSPAHEPQVSESAVGLLLPEAEAWDDRCTHSDSPELTGMTQKPRREQPEQQAKGDES
jgi:hypothetical protein